MGQLHTRNCTIFFADVEDGQFRANALAQTCESDVGRLASLFRIPFDVDGLNRGGVRVYIISPPSGGASNPGFGGILSPSDMDINDDYAPAKRDAQTPIVRGEFVRMLFVAELSEIMMDITSGGWNRGSSEGEALSVILGTEFRPMGYYGAASGAPRVNAWLRSSRPDWISQTEPTDQNAISYGCGILFINYLRHQLGFDLASIIATRPPFDIGAGGSTLAGRYAALTGKPAAKPIPNSWHFWNSICPALRPPSSGSGETTSFHCRHRNDARPSCRSERRKSAAFAASHPPTSRSSPGFSAANVSISFGMSMKSVKLQLLLRAVGSARQVTNGRLTVQNLRRRVALNSRSKFKPTCRFRNRIARLPISPAPPSRSTISSKLVGIAARCSFATTATTESST